MAKKGIWAIAGGKGGVGKSLLCSNLSIDLARQGNSVALIDADFGGPNLHSFLGINSSIISLSDFIKNKQLKIDDILLPTGISNLKFASSAHDALGMANLSTIHQKKLMQAIKTLKTDYVLIDLGAGTSSHTLDLFLMADKGVLVSVPEPTSVENTYRFIKSAFYKKLKIIIKHHKVRDLLEKITESKDKTTPRTPSELIPKISNINYQAGETLKFQLSNFKPSLVINQVRTPNDARIGFSMGRACKKYFGVNLRYAGFIEHDNFILQSIRQRRPLLLNAPNSKASNCIVKIAQNIRLNYHLVPS